MDQDLQKTNSGAVKEKTQYVLTFGVIAAMLYVAQFPTLVIFFFGAFAFLLWKMFSKPSQHGVREVFEFYLSANEILRDDERQWFGFEIQEVIFRGERILKTMHSAPPLVYFALGALYHRSGNHDAAVEHLSYIHENDFSDESTYLHPTGDLRAYVRVLRKIEREPTEAPQMSAAVRSLERARKNRSGKLLEESRAAIVVNQEAELLTETAGNPDFRDEPDRGIQSVTDGETSTVRPTDTSRPKSRVFESKQEQKTEKKDIEEEIHTNRKPITEVLHDIYDKNIQ